MASQTLLPESRVYAKEAIQALRHHGLAGGFPVLAPTDRLWSVREILDLFLAAEFVNDIQARIGA